MTKSSDDSWANLAIGIAGIVTAGAGLAWACAAVAALVTGHPVPHFELAAVAGLLASPGDPARVWQQAMPGPALYWSVSLIVVMSVAVVTGVAYRLIIDHRGGGRTHGSPRQSRPGTATRAEIRAAAGRRSLIRRGNTLRPKLRQPRPADLGYQLGRARGVRAWATVEDSILIVGPPRSGKGLHLVIPAILDAPGAVITTSTRPDNLAVTISARRRTGPVAVFDPQSLAPGLPDGKRWSLVRGCVDPQTAMIRARGLAAGTGMTRGSVEGGDFWQGQTEAVLRGMLHAAALDGRPAADLYRWSLDPVAAREAVAILGRDSAATTGWDAALDGAATADPRTRDSIWLGVRQALGALADPRVLDSVTPASGQHFDPASFLSAHGTLYLLGTASGAAAASALVTAFVEDVLETARRLAAASARSRIDPPLLLALDEIGNLAPLPSLPTLMSEGGGTGITTLAVLQSLAQARDRWGPQAAGTIWDAAIVKIILGGGSNARDLADLAALIGERDEDTRSVGRDAFGGRSTTTAKRRVPIMDTATLRTLPFGTAVLLLRTAPPIQLALQGWPARRDRTDLDRDREAVEQIIRAHASA